MPRLSKIGAAALAAFGWTSGGGAVAVTASYLVVAGGGGGGGYNAGSGGGAGGLLTGTTTLDPALSYTVLVGAGGAGGPAGVYTVASNGTSSTFDAVTTIGGGGGGSGTGTVSNGGNGGSGGGSWSGATPGSGTSGQGYAGAIGSTDSATYTNGGAGGGAGAAASAAVGSTRAGNGGIGIASSITGTSTYYAGGGGGSAQAGTQGTGGLGGGGAGTSGAGGISGTANLGGGGGGANTASGVGGSGGSGVVIISYPAPQQFGGGVVTTSGSNVIHTFTTSGTLSPLSSLTASYLIVAGGGGGSTGGGGAGGLLTGSGATIDTNSTYLVTVGAGGAGATTEGQGTSGTNSVFSIVSTTAIGGGGAGGYSATASLRDGLSGGSGGGGGARSGAGSGTGGTATSGQGNIGGNGFNNGVGGSPGGGGGGAGAVGANGLNVSIAGAGGIGLSSSISGTATYYAGGGGGCAPSSGTQGAGGNGGGGTGVSSGTPNAGTANRGGGGGGNFNTPTDPGGAGGSGIVIISYAGSTQLMAGGTVTITGGNVIHTFTSSGYLTPLRLIGNSLRFRSSNSAYLTRTNSTSGTGQGKTWTYSCWTKIGTIGTFKFLLNAGVTASSDSSVYIDTSSNLKFLDRTGGTLTTTQVFRDPAAWYHIVVAYDSTQATSSDRIKMYVNGVQVTAFGTASYPSLNTATTIGSNYIQYIGEQGNLLTNYMDAYMSEVNFVDGQQLTPNSFGTFNSYGVWQPITYGGSYGTNGFYLPFNAGTQTYAGGFNGSNQGLTTTATGINASTGTWTIEGWAYSNNASNDEAIIVGYVSGTNYIYWNYVGTTLYFGDGVTNTLTISNAKPANQWFHWAAVKNGSTYTLYINGQSIGSTTTALRSGTLTTWEIGIRTSTSNYWSGAISNVRVNSTTAVYTSNFTPPTANLTAISGTQLLTLQNATIIDNSTNAYAITNTGSVTTALNYPFSAYKIFNDQGPAGNNWTPNNISGQVGSTMDYMTDVPTLTSATAANYCVMNPLDYKGSAPTITNGNLYYTCNTSSVTRGTMGATGAKYYWEFTQVSTVNSGNPINYGIVTFASNNYGHDLSTNQRQVGMYTDNAASHALDIWENGVQTNPNCSAVFGTVNVGDVVQVAYDGTTGNLWFGKNNTWLGASNTSTGNPSAGTNPSYTFPTADQPLGPFFDHAGVSYTATLNCGQQPFTYTPPSGFVALNTYNL